MYGPDPAEVASKLNCVSPLCPCCVVDKLRRSALDSLLTGALCVHIDQIIQERERPHLNRLVEARYRSRRDPAEELVVVGVSVSDFIYQIGPHASDNRKIEVPWPGWDEVSAL